MVEKIKNLIDRLRTRWEIDITLTNTLLHLIVGAVFGLLGLIVNIFIYELIIFVPIGFLIGTIGFELAQKERNKQWNYVDSIIDILAGNIGFHIIYWITYLILR